MRATRCQHDETIFEIVYQSNIQFQIEKVCLAKLYILSKGLIALTDHLTNLDRLFDINKIYGTEKQ